MQFKKRWRDHFLAPLIFTEERDLFLIKFSIINRVPYKIEYPQFHQILIISVQFSLNKSEKYCKFLRHSIGVSYGFSIYAFGSPVSSKICCPHKLQNSIVCSKNESMKFSEFKFGV